MPVRAWFFICDAGFGSHFVKRHTRQTGRFALSEGVRWMSVNGIRVHDGSYDLPLAFGATRGIHNNHLPIEVLDDNDTQITDIFAAPAVKLRIGEKETTL